VDVRQGGAETLRPEWEPDYVEYVRGRLPRLHRIAYQLIGDGHRADDMVQDVLARLYVRWPRTREVANLDAYVHVMLVRACLADHRRAWSRVVLRGTPAERAVEAGSERVEQRLVVRAALRTLPERQRTVLVLRFLCDLPVSEVARLLNRSEGTVKSQTSYGLRALRSVIDATASTPSRSTP
jgi:RNA polymerase sigma-70 factor (sigma-E family)